MTALALQIASEIPGQAESISAAWRSHEGWLRTVVYARLREWQATEEVLQETALALIRAVTGKSNAVVPPRIEEFGPWLYRIAIRQSLLLRRKAGRARSLRERFATDVAVHAAAAPEPFAWLLREERSRLVRTALERLPARDAEILLLKYSENWSYHELAARLGVSHSAVEARLHRARARLREALAELEITSA